MTVRLAIEHFGKALVTPSRLTFALMMATFAGLLAIGCWGITAEFLAGPSGRFLARDSEDNYAFTTREALQLALLSKARAEPRLYVLGDSIVAQAFVGEEDMAGMLARETGHAWGVSILTTGGQDPLSEAALADFATRRTPGIVVIPLYPTRFQFSRQDLIDLYKLRPIGLSSAWADRQVVALKGSPDPRIGIYAIDNHKFLLRNLPAFGWRFATGRAAARSTYGYVRFRRPDELKRQRDVVLTALRKGAIDTEGDAARILAHTTRALIERGNTVIFVEAPFNEKIFETARDRALYEDYLRKTPAFAASLGARYCPLGRTDLPTTMKFADYFHQVDPATQVFFSRSLARCVVRAAAERSGHD